VQGFSCYTLSGNELQVLLKLWVGCAVRTIGVSTEIQWCARRTLLWGLSCQLLYLYL